MLTFKPILLSDRESLNRYFCVNGFANSEYNFTTLYAWRNVYNTEYAIIEDCLCFRCSADEPGYFYFPMGVKENIHKALAALMEFHKRLGRPFILMSLSEQMLEMLREFGLAESFIYEDRPEYYDYIYTREKLIELNGRKLHGKRNHFNYFVNNYDYVLEEITESNAEQCREMLINTIEERSVDTENELNATLIALDCRKELGLTGCALTADGNVAGVILAEDHHGMALIQIAKSDIGYRGASVALFKLFLERYLTGCEYVNFMEDMGLEGLRRAKLSYDPDYLIKKIVARSRAQQGGEA